jgi:hypothetical protein
MSVGEQLIWLHNRTSDGKTVWNSSFCDEVADVMELLTLSSVRQQLLKQGSYGAGVTIV